MQFLKLSTDLITDKNITANFFILLLTVDIDILSLSTITSIEG